MSDKQEKPVRRQMGPAFARPVQKPKNFKKSFVRLAKYLSPFRWRLLIILIAAVFSTIFSIRGPKIVRESVLPLLPIVDSSPGNP